jgi:hypothetical protein
VTKHTLEQPLCQRRNQKNILKYLKQVKIKSQHNKIYEMQQKKFQEES